MINDDIEFFFGRYIVEVLPNKPKSELILVEDDSRYLKGVIVVVPEPHKDFHTTQQIGDIVVFKKNTGTEIALDNKKHRILNQDQMLLKIYDKDLDIR